MQRATKRRYNSGIILLLHTALDQDIPRPRDATSVAMRMGAFPVLNSILYTIVTVIPYKNINITYLPTPTLSLAGLYHHGYI